MNVVRLEIDADDEGNGEADYPASHMAKEPMIESDEPSQSGNVRDPRNRCLDKDYEYRADEDAKPRIEKPSNQPHPHRVACNGSTRQEFGTDCQLFSGSAAGLREGGVAKMTIAGPHSAGPPSPLELAAKVESRQVLAL